MQEFASAKVRQIVYESHAIDVLLIDGREWLRAPQLSAAAGCDIKRLRRAHRHLVGDAETMVATLNPDSAPLVARLFTLPAALRLARLAGPAALELADTLERDIADTAMQDRFATARYLCMFDRRREARWVAIPDESEVVSPSNPDDLKRLIATVPGHLLSLVLRSAVDRLGTLAGASGGATGR